MAPRVAVRSRGASGATQLQASSVTSSVLLRFYVRFYCSLDWSRHIATSLKKVWRATMEQHGGRILAVCAATAAAFAASVLTVWRREAIVRKVQALGEIQLADGSTLRPVCKADAARIFALVDADREYLQEWLPWVKYVQSQADEEFFLGTCEQGQQRGTHVVFAICSPQLAARACAAGRAGGCDADDIIGLISFNAIDTTRSMVYIGCEPRAVRQA